jgi:hypothetical protein
VAMLVTIQSMKFFLRTAFGDSTTHFGGIPTSPFQGGCQGNKGAPALWLVVSVALVRLMHKLNLISQLRAAMMAIAVSFAGFLFVDNTDLIAFSEAADADTAFIIARLQTAAIIWHGGLRASSGALKPEKCSWSLADFKWVRGQWRYSTIDETPGSIEVPDLQGTFQTITRLGASEAVKVVGVHQAMDGNMTEQITALKTKADQWGAKLKSGWLPRRLVHQGSASMIWSSLRYPLPACTLTASQGELITKELYKNLLPKLGANRNYPGAYRHSPASLQGMDIPLLYIEQEIGHIRQVLTHGAIPTTTGTLMQISLEQAQLEVGLSIPFLDASFIFTASFLLTSGGNPSGISYGAMTSSSPIPIRHTPSFSA